MLDNEVHCPAEFWEVKDRVKEATIVGLAGSTELTFNITEWHTASEIEDHLREQRYLVISLNSTGADA